MTAPIGSIVAHAGPVDPEEFEPTTGWMLCDGRRLNRNLPANAALFEAIGFSWGGDGGSRFNIPDLRGYFLRGVDERRPPEVKDPDNLTRTENNPGGQTGDRVGSIQSYATAQPAGGVFFTDHTGSHSHNIDLQTDAERDVNGQSNTVAFPGFTHPGLTTEAGGSHEHEVLGGNKETRPINAYVNWIIRFK
jgi:hypothetical protein